jgi:hypothetical protein
MKKNSLGTIALSFATALALFKSAEAAHTISNMGPGGDTEWSSSGPISGTQVQLPALSTLPDGTTLPFALSFSPGVPPTGSPYQAAGAGGAVYYVYTSITPDSSASSPPPNPGTVGYIWQAPNGNTFNGNGKGVGDEVLVYNTGSDVTVDFAYGSGVKGAGDADASLQVGNTTYTSGAPDTTATFVFNDAGLLQTSSSSIKGWNSSTAGAAPEIDPASAASSLTLLLGGLAIMLGRRRTARHLP